MGIVRAALTARWQAAGTGSSRFRLALLCWLALSACRIEPVVRDETDASEAPAPPASPPRYSTDEAPLTPFRSLLQGAWAAQEPSPEEEQKAAVRRPPPLPGVQLLVLGPEPVQVHSLAKQLCGRLRNDAVPNPQLLQSVMKRLECAFPVDTTVRREALVATSLGSWGAAVAVPPPASAAAAAAWALDNQLGMLVWGERWERAAVGIMPRQDGPAGDHLLDCPEAPPLLLAKPALMPESVGLGSTSAEPAGQAPQAKQAARGSGPRAKTEGVASVDAGARPGTPSIPSPAGTEPVRAEASASASGSVAAGDAGLQDASVPTALSDAAVEPGAALAASLTTQAPILEDAATPPAQDAAVPLPPLPPPAVVFVALRTSEGHFWAAVSALSPHGERHGSVGQVAMPSRRLMVAEEGVVLVDPALARQVAPDPLAALRAYDELRIGEPVERDVIALLPEGPVGVRGPFMAYMHFRPNDPSVRCMPEGAQ